MNELTRAAFIFALIGAAILCLIIIASGPLMLKLKRLRKHRWRKGLDKG